MKRIIMVFVFAFLYIFASGIYVYCGQPEKARKNSSYGKDVRYSEAYEKFLRDTKKLRQELAGKEAEYNAAMYQWYPNPDLVGQLAKEIAALQDEIEEKARAYGLPGPIFYSNPPMGYGYGPRWGYRPWAYWAYRPAPPPVAGKGAWGSYGLDVTSSKEYQSFLRETKKLRQELAAKEAEFNAVMYQYNPNPELVGQLAKEIAELNDKIEEKARAHGLPIPAPYQHPPGGYGYGTRWGGQPW